MRATYYAEIRVDRKEQVDGLLRLAADAEVGMTVLEGGVGPASDAVADLYLAADDHEAAVLDELVEKAGLGWKCRAPVPDGDPCLYMNIGERRCAECGAARPASGDSDIARGAAD